MASNKKDIRFDSRSQKEFKNDIKVCTAIEQDLMDMYVADLNRRKGGGKTIYSYKDHGVDNSGAFIKDAKKVSAKADFMLQKSGAPDRLIEIKFSRVDVPNFHLKVAQLESYIKQDCCIVMFMGIDTPNIKYCVMLPKDYPNFIAKGERKNMWGKETIRFKVRDFVWYTCDNKKEQK